MQEALRKYVLTYKERFPQYQTSILFWEEAGWKYFKMDVDQAWVKVCDFYPWLIFVFLQLLKIFSFLICV